MKKVPEPKELDGEDEDASARYLHQSYWMGFAPWRAT